jgi:hypothetical protein
LSSLDGGDSNPTVSKPSLVRDENSKEHRMERSFASHPSDDQIEVFLLGRATSVLSELIELHCFTCQDCVEKLEEQEQFLIVLRSALRCNINDLVPSRITRISRVRRSIPFDTRTVAWLQGGAVGAVAATLLLVVVPGIGHQRENLRVPVLTPSARTLVAPRAAQDSSTVAVSRIAEEPVTVAPARSHVRTLRRVPRVSRDFQPPPTTPAVKLNIDVAQIEPPQFSMASEEKHVSASWIPATPEIPPYQPKRISLRRALAAVRHAVSILWRGSV